MGKIESDIAFARKIGKHKDKFSRRDLPKRMSALRREFNICELQKEVAQLKASVNSQTDREALEAEVKELRQNIVSPKSKGIYRNSQIHFLMWLLKNERSIFPNEFVSQADVSPNKRSSSNHI